jgi:hypothetical protein
MPIYRIRRREELVLEVQAESSVVAFDTAHNNYSWDDGDKIVSKETRSIALDLEFIRPDPSVEQMGQVEVPAPAPAPEEEGPF